MLKQALQTARYRLPFARSEQDILKLIEQESVDLILLNIMMTKITKWEAWDRLTQNTATADIPVIFVTGFKDNIDDEKDFDLALSFITTGASQSI